MRLLCTLLILEPISHSNHIIRKKVWLLFSKFKIRSSKRGWSQVPFLNTETPADQFLDKGGILAWSAILLSYPRLRLAIFIADMLHAISEASSIIFYLCQQFVGYAKSLELERLKLE